MWNGTTTSTFNKFVATTPQPAILTLACGPNISELKIEEETHLAHDYAVITGVHENINQYMPVSDIIDNF